MTVPAGPVRCSVCGVRGAGVGVLRFGQEGAAMTVAVVASVVGLACLLLGLWVGWQAGREAEYERSWREAREGRDDG